MHNTLLWVALASILITALPQESLALQPGDLVKSPEYSSVYLIGQDGKRHAFPNEAVYFSRFRDFSVVKTISLNELQAYTLGSNVTFAAGTLFKIPSVPKVYEVYGDAGEVSWIKTEADFYALGLKFSDVRDLNEAFWSGYKEVEDDMICVPFLSDETCFATHFTNCTPGAFLKTGIQGVVEIKQIQGFESGKCSVTSRITRHPNTSWVGQSMTCPYNASLTFAQAESELIQSNYASCAGGLVQLLVPKTVPCFQPLIDGVTSDLPLCE